MFIILLILQNNLLNEKLFDVLQKFELFWICIIAILFSSTSISGDTETGIIEFLKISPISHNEYFISKLIFALFQYLIFSCIYLVTFYLLSISYGQLVFIISFVLLFGPYLFIYFFVVLLLLFVSTIFKKNYYPLAIGCGFPIYLLVMNSFVSKLLKIEQFNPAFLFNNELLKIRSGLDYNLSFWVIFSIFIIVLFVTTNYKTKRFWREIKE